MKDEIKEILEFKENADYKRLSIDEIIVIKDYITNLQERNNNLKEDFKRHIDRINELTERSDNLQEENERLKENIRKDEVYFKTFELAEECDQKQDIIDTYKSRIDKAINDMQEYIDKQYRDTSDIDISIVNFWIDLLQGSDRNEKI